MTEAEKIDALYLGYRERINLRDKDGKLYFSEIFGYPSIRAANAICPADKVWRGTEMSPKQSCDGFSGICKLGDALMCLCYSQLGDDLFFTAEAMRSMCRGCKNYIPLKQERMYDPNRYDLSIFKPNYIKVFFPDLLPEVAEYRGVKMFEEAGSYVYFITDGEYIKIGKAVDPQKRLAGIQTGNPKPCSILCTIPAKDEASANALETKLHFVYSDYRLCGEWFDIYDKIDRNLFARVFPSCCN